MSRAEDRGSVDEAVLRALRAPHLSNPPDAWIRDGLERLERLERSERSERSEHLAHVEDPEHVDPAKPSPIDADSSARNALRGLHGFVERVRRTATGEIRELLGQLVSDTADGAALVGVRGGERVARQILFQYPDAKLFLRISAQSKGFSLLAGQYVPMGTVDFRESALESVTLYTSVGAYPCVALHDGEFQFEDVPAGEVYLSLRRKDRVLAFDPIRI